MKTHSLPLQMKYVSDRRLENTIPWRWYKRVDALQRRCTARLYNQTKETQPPPTISYEQAILRRVINKL